MQAAEKVRSAQVKNALLKIKAGKTLTAAEQKLVDDHFGQEKKKPGLLDEYPSMKACSGATGIPLKVLKNAKRGGCPAFHKSNRVNFRALLPWIFEQSTDSSDYADLIKKVTYETKTFELEKKQGSHLPVEEVKEAYTKFTANLFSMLERSFVAEAPGECAHLGQTEIRIINKRRLTRISEECHQLAK